MPEATAEQLPSREELGLLDYKIASVTSELDDLVSRVERALEPSVPLDDAFFMGKHGIALPEKGEPLDDETLARWLVSLTSLLDDAETIRKAAQKMQLLLAGDYRDRHQTRPEVDRYWEQAHAYHREHVAWLERQGVL